MADLLQWLNLLLIPIAGGVLNITGRLSTLEAKSDNHGQRLKKLDGIG